VEEHSSELHTDIESWSLQMPMVSLFIKKLS